MTLHVVFTLYAPYGAWGSPSLSAANAAYKPAELEPSKSALVGLVGAALGEPRSRLGELARALAVAVREDLPPVREPQPDYHTISKAHPPAGRARDHWTRFEELRPLLSGGRKALEAGSILSAREYWTNGLWTVALVPRTDAWSAGRLADALKAPCWTLYAGRKACTLGLPPDPEVVESETLIAALNRYGCPWDRHPQLAPLAGLRRAAERRREPVRILCDADYPGRPHREREVTRRDLPAPVEVTPGRWERRFDVRIQEESYHPAGI